MRLAGFVEPVPVYDNSLTQNIMKFQNKSMSNPVSQSPSTMASAVNMTRASVSSSSRTGDVKMYAGPKVSGDASMSVNMNHMDDAMVAKMGINGFGRIGRLVFRSTFLG